MIYYADIRRTARIYGHYRRLVVDEAFRPLFLDFAEGRKIDGAPRGAPGSLLSRVFLLLSLSLFLPPPFFLSLVLGGRWRKRSDAFSQRIDYGIR